MTSETLRASAVPFCLALVCSSVVLGRAKTVAADAPTRDPDAVRLLHEVGNAYRALPAYVDRAEVVVTLGEHRGDAIEESSTLRLTFLRPDRFAIETAKHDVVSNGETLTIANKPFKQYISTPAPKVETIDFGVTDGLDAMTSMELVLDMPLSVASGVLIHFVRGDDPMEAMLRQEDSLRIAPDTVLEGKPAKVLVIADDSGKQPMQIRLTVDPGSKLLKRMELTELGRGRNSKVVWTVQSISTKAPAAAAFAFRPAPGFVHAKGNTLKGTAVLSMAKSMAKYWALGFSMGARQAAPSKD